MKPLAECLLYTFVDTAYLRGRDAAEVARQLCDGGSDLVQLRAKSSSLDEVRRLAEVMQPVLHSAGVGFVINDHPLLAVELGADFCHLGQEDFAPHGQTREIFAAYGKGGESQEMPRVGLSSHAPDEARRAVAAGADYVAVGPVYATPTKPGRPPVTLEYVRWAAANVSIPWFAIGGIHQGNVSEVLEAGARRICVVSAILLAENIARSCQLFKKHLTSASR